MPPISREAGMLESFLDRSAEILGPYVATSRTAVVLMGLLPRDRLLNNVVLIRDISGKGGYFLGITTQHQ